MAVVIVCPTCGQKMKVPDESALGRKVQCPGCSTRFVSAATDDVYPVAPVVAAKKASPERTAAERQMPRDSAREKPAASEKKKPRPGASSEASTRPAKPAKSKSPSRDEDVLEVVEVVEVEDEWAGLAPAAPRRGKPEKPNAAPAVLGKKKKASTEKRGEPAATEMSVNRHRLLMIGTGLAGGLFAMTLWAVIIHWRGIGAGYLAVLVGLCVGFGVRVGASRWDYGWAPAITATVMTVMAILGGKAVAHRVLNVNAVAAERARNTAAYVALLEHENYQIQRFADAIIEDRLKKGLPIHSNEGREMSEDDSDAEDSEDVLDLADAFTLTPEKLAEAYPPAIWNEAATSWKELPDDERATRKKEAEDKIAQAKEGTIADERYQTSADHEPIFDILDIFWLICAVSAAFRLATGMSD